MVDTMQPTLLTVQVSGLPVTDDKWDGKSTPTPESHSLQDVKDRSSIQQSAPNGDPVFYDTTFATTPRSPQSAALPQETSPPKLLDPSGGARSTTGDASRPNFSDPSLFPDMSEQVRGAGSRRGRSHSQSASSRRPPARPAHTPPSHIHPISSPHATSQPHENLLPSPGPHTSYQPPPSYQASLPYNQRGAYGQYTMSPQARMGTGHPPSPFPYSHPFPPDNNNLMSQSIHVGYPSIMQPHAAVYPYQTHSPDAASASHPTFSGNSNNPALFSHHHQVNPSPPPHSPITQPSSEQATAYQSQTGSFHPLRFTSPVSTPPYAYPPTYAGSPSTFQSQYAPSPYAQHYPDQEPQGTWWYLPHGAALSARQYDNVQQTYQNHYPINYTQMGHRGELDSPYAGVHPSESSVSISYSAETSRNLQPESSPTLQSEDPPSFSLSSAPQSPPSSAAGPSSPIIQAPKPERPLIRRHYHPNPPPHRSEWVMWAGNVPSDMTHDELWRFFNQPLPSHLPDGSSPDPSTPSGGAVSVFLISRSNCAFINFDTEPHLHAAIARFNGQPVRPAEPRCPRLVCRIRKQDDDLKAGVGGQRGIGMHTRWVKDRKGKGREGAPEEPSSGSVSEDPVTPASSSPDHRQGPLGPPLALSSDEEGRFNSSKRPKGQSSSPGSFASTNSSMLARHFPKRYFILKSLTQFDLDLSIEKGLWATQKHNEGILDQAFRTSKVVYLIFSVNKSGEFYGYARMVSPILQGEHRVSWATRTSDSSPSSHSSLSPVTGRSSLRSALGSDDPISPSRSSTRREDVLFPDKLIGESPMSMLSSEQKARGELLQQAQVHDDSEGEDDDDDDDDTGEGVSSAPAEMFEAHRKLTAQTPDSRHSLDMERIRPVARTLIHARASKSQDEFHLDGAAPSRAVRPGKQSSSGDELDPAKKRSLSLHPVAEEEEKPEGSSEGEGGSAMTQEGQPSAQGEDETREEGWGESFKIEWICTDRLPFYRTRHLRNPWNHEKEIKVSRDGTEVEPTVGQKLLDEWKTLADLEQQPQATAGTASAPPVPVSRRGPAPGSRPAPPSPRVPREGGLSRS